MLRLNRPVHLMKLDELDAPPKYYLDCPIDVFPSVECRRIEIPRELARYITELQETIEKLEGLECQTTQS